MDDTENKRPERGLAARLVLSGLSLIVCAVIVVGAVLGASWLIETKPQPQRRSRGESVALVEVARLEPVSVRVVVEATGTVVPAREVILGSRVSGEVIAISENLIPGGKIAAEDDVLQIEKTDYELAAAGRQADLVQAQYEYQLEMGRQDVARSEWEMLNDRDRLDDLDRALMLREPHLAAAKARVLAAEAALDRAELDLRRTTIKAPFNLIVREKLVDLGTQVSAQTPLARVVGIDEYWVEATLPAGQLSWLTFPGKDAAGTPARIVMVVGDGAEKVWQGELLRQNPDLEPNGRLARVVVRIPDPLRQNEKMPLLIGAFVQVFLDGPILENVYKIPRSAVHGGNTIWYRDAEKRLQGKQISWVYADRETVLVADGLGGLELVLSDLGAPVMGMRLGTAGEEKPGGKDGKTAEPRPGRED